jgi:hypothetical protein
MSIIHYGMPPSDSQNTWKKALEHSGFVGCFKEIGPGEHWYYAKMDKIRVSLLTQQKGEGHVKYKIRSLRCFMPVEQDMDDDAPSYFVYPDGKHKLEDKNGTFSLQDIIPNLKSVAVHFVVAIHSSKEFNNEEDQSDLNKMYACAITKTWSTTMMKNKFEKLYVPLTKPSQNALDGDYGASQNGISVLMYVDEYNIQSIQCAALDSIWEDTAPHYCLYPEDNNVFASEKFFNGGRKVERANFPAFPSISQQRDIALKFIMATSLANEFQEPQQKKDLANMSAFLTTKFSEESA